MEIKERFDVIYSEEVYDFLKGLEFKAREKIIYNIDKARVTLDSELFKKLSENIWEFRTLYNKIHYRLLAFWDNEGKTLVVVTHGFIKKSNKTPFKEIKKAEDVRNEYYKKNNTI